MEMRPSPVQPKVLQPRHTTGPAPAPPADQASPTKPPPPLRDQYQGYPSSSSSSFRTQLRPRSATGATGAPKPSRTDPPSPKQERAPKQAARRYPPLRQHNPGSTSAPPHSAASEDRGDPAPATGGENLQAEQPPNATNPRPTATLSPTRRQTLHGPVPTRERHQPLTLPRTRPATDSHQDSPAKRTTPETPINHPATSPASPPAPTRAPRADAQTRVQHHGPHLQHRSRKRQHWLGLYGGHTARRPRPNRLPRRLQTGRRQSPAQQTTRHQGQVARGAHPEAQALEDTGGLPTPRGEH